MVLDVWLNAAVPRALVLGAFGGAALVLTVMYSTRGPLILPVYAALLAALGLLLARYTTVSYAGRFVAALVGFSAASVFLYVAVVVLVERERQRLRRAGRLRDHATGVSLAGHAWRVGFLLAVGAVASAGVAFVSV